MRYSTELATASGQSIQVRGIAKMKIQVGDYETFHEVVVLNDLKTDFIIGVDFMEKHNYSIDMANKQIQRVKKKETRDPLSAVQSPRDFYLEPLSHCLS